MRLDDIKYFQSLRSAWAILQSELKAYIKPPLYENDKGHTTIYTQFWLNLKMKKNKNFTLNTCRTLYLQSSKYQKLQSYRIVIDSFVVAHREQMLLEP